MISEYTATVTGGVHSAFVNGHYVYLTDDATGSLRVIDFADVNKPKEVARWQVETSGQMQIALPEGEGVSTSGRYLHDVQKPRHIQHAVLQIGDRMARHDTSVSKWYPALVSLAASPSEEIRSADAWTMGQDNSVREFHAALLKLLGDPSPTVRGNAALALVRFGDASGRQHIVSMLQPAHITAPRSGRILDMAKPGALIHQNGLLAKLQAGNQTVEVRVPLTGHLRAVLARQGDEVSAGSELGIVDPGADQAWEALRALYVIGIPEDIPAIVPYQHQIEGLPERVRQQAVLTEEAIRGRASAKTQ